MGALNVSRWPGLAVVGRCGLNALGLALLLAGEAQAQVPPAGVPGQIDPGLQREQLERNQRQQAIEERARRVVVPALKGEAPDAQQLPEQGERFELSGISFNASVFLEKQTLEALARPYIGRPITFADLNALLREVNALYEQQGQLTARALIPPQTLSDGRLRIVLVEAKVDQVIWQGQPPKVDQAFYEARMPVQSGETLDSLALMNSIERFNATTPGPQVTASLAPGQSFGTTRVELEAFEPGTFQWSAFVNNYGNEGTGREQYGGTATWFSPTGVADAFSAIVVATSGSQYGSLRYSRPVNRYNGIAYVEAGANTLEIQTGPFAALNIEGESQTYGLGYDQPWWIDRQWLLLGGLGWNHQESETTIEGLALSETSVDEIVLKGQFEYRAAPWYARYEQRIRQANTDNQVTGESGSYQLLNGTAYLSRSLAEQRFEVVGRLGWQYASDTETLPSTLLYQFGGISSVRGYDPGVIAAPQGMTLNLEAYWNYSERWQPFVFFDYGRAMELGTADVDLDSIGVGLNFNWGKHLSVSVVAANTLTDVVPDQDSGQVLAQITLR
ncbi:ShlB/FhaC/HecB family hemolysin secretion/activation protein [Stutzerimonas sp. VN223-3]|uniref:ShlB/FhaC/HecB family hemolysin secretion/activation protein n=1 Tax=Stutzerimonas sp. VN223-3 TaxID=3384601 RepID=UPI0038B42EF6